MQLEGSRSYIFAGFEHIDLAKLEFPIVAEAVTDGTVREVVFLAVIIRRLFCLIDG
jgi:hypothetical protein